MPARSTDAFVLRTYRLAENDKIVVLFTHDFGKLRFVAKGARKMKNRFGAALEVFARIRIQYHEKPNRELQLLDRAELLYSPFEKQTKLRTNFYLFYFAELANEFYPDHEKNLRAFQILMNIERAVRNGQNLDYLARYVELQMLHSQGILSSVASCTKCGREFQSYLERRYLGPASEVFCKSCRNQECFPLSAAIIKSMDYFEKGSMNWAATLPGSILEELASLNHVLITRFLGKELNSYRLRKQMV